jgi:hypothetical protein
MMLKATLIVCCALLAWGCLSAKAAGPIPKTSEALEFSITAYQRSEVYSGYVFDTTLEQLSSFATGSKEGAVECFMLMQYGELPGGEPDWLGPELARYGGNLQRVCIHGAEFTLYSSAVDWVEIEVRGCPMADVKPYLAVMDLEQGLDERIKNQLYRPLGRIAFAVNKYPPVAWPQPEQTVESAP